MYQSCYFVIAESSFDDCVIHGFHIIHFIPSLFFCVIASYGLIFVADL